MSNVTRFATWIGKIGPSPGFVAFNAHCWFAAFVVATAIRAGLPALPTAILAVALAAAKEFWFDLKYETPKQTVEDSAGDIGGYLAGIIVGVLAGGI